MVVVVVVVVMVVVVVRPHDVVAAVEAPQQELRHGGEVLQLIIIDIYVYIYIYILLG